MILMYHKIYPESPTMWWVDADNFYRQMCELKCRKIVSLDDYDPADPDQVVITFDGVYKNVLTFAAPLLKDFGYLFELFVTSDYVGKDNSFDSPEPKADFASIEDLKELITYGGRLQWHSKTHRKLKEVVDETIIASELAVPEELRRLDENGFKWFAYPNGDFNPALVEQTKKLFSGGISCNQGNDTDRFMLNRVTVTNETTFKKGSITVVIASYNYGPYLIEAIESVLRQTRPVDEILIADDCSTDNTMEIGKAYEKRYPALIKYFRNEQNLGIVKNFNKAVSMAKGDYVCILGADNRFRSDYIEKTAEVLDSDGRIAIAYTDFALFGPRAKLIYSKFFEEWRGPVREDYYYIIQFPHFDEKSKQILRERGNFMHGSSLYRKAVFHEIGGYREQKDTPEDYSLFLRFINGGWSAKRVPYPVLEYRQHSKDQTNIRLESFAELNYYKTQFKLVSNEIAQKVQELGRRDQQLAERSQLLEDRDQQLAEQDLQLTERDLQLTERDRVLAAREGTLHLMRSSLSWRLTTPLRMIHDWREILSESKRSGVIRTLNEALKILRNEGIISLIRKSWNRLTAHQPARIEATLRNDVGPLTFPLVDQPRASIVIPVYNKVLYTQNCLASIIENTIDVAYEVIVVDDNSSDATAEKLAQMRNLKVLHSEKNQGFVGSCNAGAAEARGEYILFLNNDTVVTPGWLATIVDTLDRDPHCGAVGSKLVYPDGTLQEAGGIIWKDASGWNYGKFDDPNKPEYNYVRAVDYCSGAALMVRKELFEKIGSFDRRFSPAYWEDTDLCFSLRKLGYKVLYQPASVVVHYEGISAGTSTTSGMKRFQDVNTSKFIEKWSDELSRQYVNNLENVFLARDRNRGKRILVIDHYVPTYDKDAGSFYMFSLLKVLVALDYRIVFWPENLSRMEPYTTDLQQMGIEVIYGQNNFSTYMDKFGKFFDCAILTRNHIAIKFVDEVKTHISKILFHAIDVEYVREKRRFELENRPVKELDEIKKREVYLFNASNIITTVNEEEAEMIRQIVPGKQVIFIHYPINKITNMTTPFAKRQDLLFVGSSHPPNTDAILYFAERILPLLLRSLPEIKLYVVGGNPDKKLRELESKHIVLTGFVKDLLPYYEKCRVFIAPLRYGAGVKGKVIDTMSYGLPVVTTSVGAEGLGVTNGEQLLIANENQGIADSISRLYSDEQLWTRLSVSSREFVERDYSQEAFKAQVALAMEDALRAC